MDFILTAIFLGVIGLVGLAASAEAINSYSERIEKGMDSYTDLYHTNYTTARQESFANQDMNHLAESIWKVRDDCIESAMVARSDKRHELFELLAQAATLVDAIRVKG